MNAVYMGGLPVTGHESLYPDSARTTVGSITLGKTIETLISISYIWQQISFYHAQCFTKQPRKNRNGAFMYVFSETYS